jgi:NAD(P)-dependent dehydrogenase (short-subunit alcohol dehydrogenase family)
MANPLQFDGKVVLIAGSAGEIGGYVAQAFLTAGAHVVVCGLTPVENLPKAEGRRASFVLMDGSEPDHIIAVVESVKARYGRLDVLIYTAVGPIADSACADPAELVIRRGLVTPLHFSQAANRLMQEQAEGGSIINVSHLEQPPPPSLKPHAVEAASTGLASLGASLAVEWAPLVRINTVTLNLTQTEHAGSRGKSRPVATPHRASQANDAFDLPPQIGRTCLFLASSLASYVSGAHLT